MSIADYEIPTETVPIDAKHSFTVRGVDFSDLSALAYRHGPVLGLLYSRVTKLNEKGSAFRPEDLGAMLTSSAREFPDLVADLIAVAADEPDQAKKIRKLRFPVQVDALHKIVGLTLIGEHELKKLLEIVAEAAEATTRAVKLATRPTNSAPSGNGSGAFADA